MALLFTGCKNNSNKQQAASNEVEEVEIVEVNEPIAEEPIFLMKTSMGNIKIKLYKETPLHRDNFVKLAKSGYYDGLLFHRVIDGFMIQGGDPLTRDASKADRYGTGGPNYTVPAEFVPEFKHKKGALAAARRGDSVNPEKASSGSQFYLVQDENSCAQL
ncbi:MAG: peptidylprolyl isomerase, partial [Bacteroidales bacterium]|nr:peptidylprolyl isomerase [Bacteroidales bacterium]